MSLRDSDRASGGHPREESLLDYVEGGLADPLAFEIEEHFSVCDDCVRLARSLRRASAAVADWTAAKHAYVVEALAMESALRIAETGAANLQWRERLQRWRTDFGARAQAAARVTVRTVREATLSVAGELQSLLMPGGWEFVPVAMDRSDAVKVLQVRGVDESRFAVSEETLPGGARAWVLTLTLPRTLAGSEPLIAMVVDVANPERCAISEAVPAGDALTVVFRGLPPGEYIAVVEPRGASR